MRGAFTRVSDLIPPTLPAWPGNKPLTLLLLNSNVAEKGPGSCLHRTTDASPVEFQDAHPGSTVFSALCFPPSHSLVSEPGCLGEGQHHSYSCLPVTLPLLTLPLHHAQS